MSLTKPIPLSVKKIVDSYVTAKELVIANGYADEIDWQDGLRFSQISESEFLREAAWVILSSGMRETVVRKKFPLLSTAFLNWRCAKAIRRQRSSCCTKALAVFNHQRKIDAIIKIVINVAEDGFGTMKSHIEEEGVDYIRTLPFMGPATAFHLAKNLGLDVVKPDRHLVRIARIAGFESPARLCRAIADQVGDRIAVIDLVIWRYATLKRDYAAFLS